jgi:NAD(P)-dependent dehydrogenase (short-subunit alcohol dehydrogenase family)
VIEQHGRLDILVNNAGVTVDRPILSMTVDDWHKVLRVNLSGAFYMSKPALEHMIERGSGRIINISSIIGEIGNIGQANYPRGFAVFRRFGASVCWGRLDPRSAQWCPIAALDERLEPLLVALVAAHRVGVHAEREAASVWPSWAIT